MIKNIVFDVGNVLIRWDPMGIITQAFPHHTDQAALTKQLFKSPTWFDLNQGVISETVALQRYQQELGLENTQLEMLIQTVRNSLQPLDRSIALLIRLHAKQFPLYALTDNTHEIMAYLRQKYTFWTVFSGIVVSAEVGHLKPNPAIYQHLLNTYNLSASETVFIDDHPPNVQGALDMGMAAICFENIEQCTRELEKLQIYAT